MSRLLYAARIIDTINARVGRAVSWLVLAAVLVSATNATTRKLFNLSSNAWLEAQWYLFSAVILMCAAWTLLSSEHVKVDLIYGQLPRKAQIWIDILGTIFFLFPFCLITIYLSWPVFLAKLESGEVSNNTGGLLLWPVWLLIPVGFSLLLLQGVSELIKRIAILRGLIPDPVHADAATEAALQVHGS
ncbi:TRAP transporter small permease subunit [Chelativorans sp. J32]|uniref:TRAP transporter small permease subunit n=1 Tax=Chelativorans sp. J32 TaxID=935840 RepID=UPI00048A0259|nr:TRAP transporter small permease subunit [Chelativorans sp. J32]